MASVGHAVVALEHAVVACAWLVVGQVGVHRVPCHYLSTVAPTPPLVAHTQHAPDGALVLDMRAHDFNHARALAFAARLEREKPGDLNLQIVRAFQLTYQRQPLPAEMKACCGHIAKSLAHHKATKPVKVEPPKYVIRQMVEEMTGLDFWWVEDLDIYSGNEYVPDLKPWDAKPHTRALAELCLVLFNSNEFVYIY